MTVPSDSQDTHTIANDVLASRVARELAAAECMLAELQAVLSAVLASGDIEASALRDIQHLDLATQTLGGLSRLVDRMAESGRAGIPAADIAALVTLGDLGARLTGPGEHTAPALRTKAMAESQSEPADGAADFGDVAWL